MHWYRLRPHEAYLWPSPSSSSLQYLRFAQCCKIKGYIDDFGNGLCYLCYSLLPTGHSFTPFFAHYVYDGHEPPRVNCENCETTPLVVLRPLSTCSLCRRTHLNILTALENGDQAVRDVRSILIFIEGNHILTYD